MNKEITLSQYQKASREFHQKEAKKGFLANLAAYAIVNSILVTVNILLAPVFPWAVFPLIGWGIGIMMHYTFGVKRIEAALKHEEARIEQYAIQN